MADFQPTTAIWLFKNTKVTLQNQPYFTSEGAKLSWYAGHSPKTFTSYSYQREPRQYIRVEGNADDLRGYDMMAFRNSPGARAIFCRIIDIGFVNPNVTQITFETDAMQTFIDVLRFEDSWVEREMVKDDWNGSLPSFNNLLPEGLESGEVKKLLIGDTFDIILEGGSTLVALSAYDSAGEPNYSLSKEGAFYYGLNKINFVRGAGFESFLKTYEQKGRLDGIVGVWCVPTVFAGTGAAAFNEDVTLPTTIDGYEPKNAKCFSSEFCKIELSNRQGESSFLLPEYLFEGRTAQINIGGSFAAGGGYAYMKPSRYMGNGTNTIDYGVTLPLNTQTCYIGNAFANWIGQNKFALAVEGIGQIAAIGSVIGTMGVSAVGSATGIGSQIVMGNAVGNLGNQLFQTTSSMAGIAQHAQNPAAARGQTGNGAGGMAMGNFCFDIYFNSPTAENIKSVDDFFTVYGYRTCRAKKPNVDTRPFWNYVKCAPATVSGPITMKDKQEIESILNSGVTFWHVTRGAVIGDYSMDNRG